MLCHDFEDVAEAVATKMIKRHPHVFADLLVEDANAQSVAWETQKENERTARAEAEGRAPSVLDDVAAGCPALMRAHKLQKRAARVGFDWPDLQGPRSKLDEEVAELDEAVSLSSGAGPGALPEDLWRLRRDRVQERLTAKAAQATARPRIAKGTRTPAPPGRPPRARR